MNRKIAGLGLPVFFFLPWLGFLFSLFNIRSKMGAFVYIAFAMVFGYAISFVDPSADSYRYAQAFSKFDNTLNYNKIVQLYSDGELRDMYRLVLFYFVSLFSNNPKIMYAFAGLVFGILSYLSLLVFVKERGKKWDKFVFLLALIFFTYISLANVNGFRFNTGAIILFLSIYKFIIQKKKTWILGVLVTPLFHYGFILIVPILIFYRFSEHIFYSKEKVSSILIYVFILSFFASWLLEANSINLGFLSKTDILSGAVGSRLDYLNSTEVKNLVESRRESSLFLIVQKYFIYAIKIYVFISVLFVQNLLKNAKGDKSAYLQLFAFVLFFYTTAFLASSLPSGARFLSIAHLFLILLLCKIYAVYNKNKMKKLIVWSLPVFSFNIAFTNFMLPFLILTPTFWYGNLFWIIIEGIGFIQR